MIPNNSNLLHHVERRLFFDAPPLILAGVAGYEALTPGTSAVLAGWPLVISLFFIGMPHGAIDLAVTEKLRSESGGYGRLLQLAAYFVAMIALLALLIASPVVALAIFAVVSALHFGLADARDLDRRHSGPTPRIVTWLSATARGVLLLSSPFLFAPAESFKVITNIVQIANDSQIRVEISTILAFVSPLFVAALAAHALTTVSRMILRQQGVAVAEILETSAIALSFAVLHPLFAMGLYVLAWHSWRHLHTLTRFFEPNFEATKTSVVLRRIMRIHVSSLPWLTPTLIAFGLVAWWRLDTWTSEHLAALTIAIFAVVTLPHHLLVERIVEQLKQPSTLAADRTLRLSAEPGIH